ncbi:ankyrin repeat-containing domain protein [Trichoderma chlorosporum]
MVSKTRRNGAGEDGRKYRARSDAPVPPKLNEGGMADAASAITIASDSLWLNLIKKEALAILDLIHSHVNKDRIFLVGYGLGGIVIKRAIVLANTISKYNDIAFQVDRLVFFSTPHRDGEKKEWERVIEDIMQVADAKTPRRLPEILFGLFRSSSQISQDFHKFAVKYPITNFIEKSDESAANSIMGEGELINDMDDVEWGLEKELHNLTLHKVDTLDHLETLRTLFGLKQACSNGLTSRQQDYGGICDYKYLLHRAAQENNLKAFMALLRMSENASEVNEEGMTLLHMAAAGGSTSMISLLLDKCTIEHEPTNVGIRGSLDKLDNRLRTPLIMAAKMGHEEATKLLLQSGANISIQDDTGKTALHYGALKSPVAVENFISSDLARLCDNSGCTPLHIAANSVDYVKAQALIAASEAGQVETVRYLLSKEGVPPDAEWNKRLPICQAAAGGHIQVVCTLLRFRCSVINADYQKMMALHYAADRGDLVMVQMVITPKAEVDALDIRGESPLHIAARNGKTDVVKLLLEYGAWKDRPSSEGKGPLHLAIAHPMVVKALLEAGADPNVVDEKSQTPLQLAVQGGFWQSVRYLLKHKANARKLGNDERPPLYYAITNDHLLTVQEFLKHDETLVDLSTQIPWAMESTASTVFKYFLSLAQKTVDDFANFKTELLYGTMSGFDANLQRQGSSPLHWAAKRDRIDYIRSLIKFDARLDARDSSYKTPLHSAAEENADDAVKVLLHKGSDINAKDNDAATPIYLAAKFRAKRALEKLITGKHKANMNIATLSKGWTPLHVSIRRGGGWITEPLLNAGANPNLAAHDGWTPLHIAAFMGKRSAVELLLQHEADPNIPTNMGNRVLHMLLIDRGADIDLRSSEKLSILELAVNARDIGILNFLLSTNITSRADPKWQLDDLITAYRRAITLYCQYVTGNQEKEASKCLDIVKALLEKEPELSGTESDMGVPKSLHIQLFKGGNERNEGSFDFPDAAVE